MIAIRGATTVAQDEKEEIKRAVKELLEQIESCNEIKRDEIVSIVFTSTSDIHSYYPATAARDAGFGGSALFSAAEPDIEGGLPLCIRVMIFIGKNIEPHHVYLRGAKILRRDLMKIVNIAIDGPSGSGKSTLAKRIAETYSILYLDTGAMYRACALEALDRGIDIEDETQLCDMLRTLDLSIEYENGKQKTVLRGQDVSERIREPQVSMAASTVSKYPSVRLKMVEKQREIAGKLSCVLDGRDIGTYVLPDADFKFFLTASPRVRAQRRYEEMKAKGYDVDFDRLEEEIVRRDTQDSTRDFAPLKKADDAFLIDTSDMTVEEVLAEIKQHLNGRL